jgi:5'-3' exonuclease
VDCITGVPGVGPVKAKELLRNFSSLDGIYENLDAVPHLALRGASELAKKLQLHQTEAKLSRELATIICNANDRHEGFANAVPSSLELGDLDFSSFEQFLGKYRFNEDDSNHLLSIADRFTHS